MPNNIIPIKKQIDDAYRRGFLDCFRQEIRRSEVMSARFENQKNTFLNTKGERPAKKEVWHER